MDKIGSIVKYKRKYSENFNFRFARSSTIEGETIDDVEIVEVSTNEVKIKYPDNCSFWVKKEKIILPKPTVIYKLNVRRFVEMIDCGGYLEEVVGLMDIDSIKENLENKSLINKIKSVSFIKEYLSNYNTDIDTDKIKIHSYTDFICIIDLEGNEICRVQLIKDHQIENTSFADMQRYAKIL
jgi:hypothetical protein